MKKMIIILLCVVFIFSHTSININALENNEIEYLDNGYYIITAINEETVLKSTKTKTGTKTKKFYNSNNQVIWSVSVHGTFTYTGNSSKCTAATVSTTCPGSTWKIISSNASKSGNKAIANAVAGQYIGGQLSYKVSASVTLTCSVSGKLS